MTRRLSLKSILLSILLALLLLAAIPVSFLAWNYFSDPDPVNSYRAGYTNDASRLEETEVTVVHAASDSGTAIEQIAGLIIRAKKEGKKISIAGAQHSMGGHTIYPGGIVLDMKGFNYMQLDTVANILHVGAGAMWSGIIPYLEKFHRSVAVMQSNNSFSVGGSVSVNCHGWQPESPPIASTVQSFRLMNADGQLLNCSRTENEELFSLALGGYGLFGDR